MHCPSNAAGELPIGLKTQLHIVHERHQLLWLRVSKRPELKHRELVIKHHFVASFGCDERCCYSFAHAQVGDRLNAPALTITSCT
jgi:hypothetical protein